MRYKASMRAGKTKTTSSSLDAATLKNLKALAARRHEGNVSALLAEVASREAKFAAAEAYFEKYGIPPLSQRALATGRHPEGCRPVCRATSSVTRYVL